MRLWQVRFQILKPIESLPIPDEIVLEVQNSPSYHLEGGKRRVDEGCAQIVTTVSGEGAFRCRNKITRLLPGKTFMARLCDPTPPIIIPDTLPSRGSSSGSPSTANTWRRYSTT